MFGVVVFIKIGLIIAYGLSGYKHPFVLFLYAEDWAALQRFHGLGFHRLASSAVVDHQDFGHDADRDFLGRLSLQFQSDR